MGDEAFDKLEAETKSEIDRLIGELEGVQGGVDKKVEQEPEVSLSSSPDETPEPSPSPSGDSICAVSENEPSATTSSMDDIDALVAEAEAEIAEKKRAEKKEPILELATADEVSDETDVDSLIDEFELEEEIHSEAAASIDDVVEDSLEDVVAEVEREFDEKSMAEIQGELSADEDFDLAEGSGDLDDIRAESSDGPGLEDTVGDFKQDEIHNGSTIMDQEQFDDDGTESVHSNVHRIHNEGDTMISPGDGKLSLTLSGKMTLDLNFESGSQAIAIQFHEEFMVVKLSNGAEFKIPLKSVDTLSKAG